MNPTDMQQKDLYNIKKAYKQKLHADRDILSKLYPNITQ